MDPLISLPPKEQAVIIRNTLTVFQLTPLLAWGLHGILCVQTYNYYLSFPSDPIMRKLVVYLVLLLETVEIILVTHDTYQIFVVGFGNILSTGNLQMLPLSIPILGGIIGLICHSIFAHRIMLISRSKTAGILVGLLALGSVVSSLLFGVELFLSKNFAEIISASSTSSLFLSCGLWNGFGASCDVLIALCTTFYLSKAPKGFRKTNFLITRVIHLTIETGIITAASSVICTVLFVGFRTQIQTSVFFVIPSTILTKMYSITILATFNNRPNAIGGPPPISDTANSRFNSSLKNSFSKKAQESRVREIHIGRTVVQQVWTDEIPMSSAETFKGTPGAFINIEGGLPHLETDDRDLNMTGTPSLHSTSQC